jgi:hypothetical protein
MIQGAGAVVAPDVVVHEWVSPEIGCGRIKVFSDWAIPEEPSRGRNSNGHEGGQEVFIRGAGRRSRGDSGMCRRKIEKDGAVLGKRLPTPSGFGKAGRGVTQGRAIPGCG